MIKTNPSKCKALIIRSKNQQIPSCKSLNPMKMSCATSTKALTNGGFENVIEDSIPAQSFLFICS